MNEGSVLDVDINELKNTSKKLQGNCSGIYFLFDGDELVYIGKGWNCLLRIAEHTRKDSNKKFTSWEYLHIEDKTEYSRLEKKLIKLYSPKYNVTFNTERSALD